MNLHGLLPGHDTGSWGRLDFGISQHPHSGRFLPSLPHAASIGHLIVSSDMDSLARYISIL
jgi:hypothetical protein